MRPQLKSLFLQLTDLSARLVRSNPTNEAKYFSSLGKVTVNTFHKEQAAEIIAGFKQNRAIKHPFFEYLQELSKTGMSANQYNIWRYNFCYGAQDTIILMRKHIAKAVEEGDYTVVANMIQKLYQECGKGNPEHVYLALLQNTLDIMSKEVMGVPILRIQDADKVEGLLPEAIAFRKTQVKLYSSSYSRVIGSALAQEVSVDHMIKNLRQTVFEPYGKGYLAPDRYSAMMEYFDVREDDGKEGGDDELASHIIAVSSRNIKDIKEGGERFLTAQGNFLDAVTKRMKEAKGYIIPTNPPSKKPYNMTGTSKLQADLAKTQTEH